MKPFGYVPRARDTDAAFVLAAACRPGGGGDLSRRPPLGGCRIASNTLGIMTGGCHKAVAKSSARRGHQHAPIIFWTAGK